MSAVSSYRYSMPPDYVHSRLKTKFRAFIFGRSNERQQSDPVRRLAVEGAGLALQL